MNVASLSLWLFLALTQLPVGDAKVAHSGRRCFGSPGTVQANCYSSVSTIPAGTELSGQGVVTIDPESLEFDVVRDREGSASSTADARRRVPFSGLIAEADSSTVVMMTLGTPEDARAIWSVALSAKEFTRAKTVVLPEGRFDLVVRAPHYRDAHLLIDASGQRSAPASVVLRRIPSISGRVLLWSDSPAVDAAVELIPGDRSCRTSPTGAFLCEARGEWPAAVRITHPGAGIRVVPLTGAARDVRLGDIRLHPSGTLRLRITSSAAPRIIDLSVVREAGGPAIEVATRSQIATNGEPVLVSGLEAGDYRLLISGERPFQRYSRTFRVVDSETVQTITLRESQLTLNVVSGSQREARAAVTLKSIDGKWRGTVTMDEAGSATEPLWQSGEYSFSVRPMGAATPVLGHGSLGDDDFLQWTIEVPSGRIAGFVLDDDGHPVADASVALVSDDGETQRSMRASADANGAFLFDHVAHGSQTLTARSDGYLPGPAVQFQLATDENRMAEVRLRKGSAMRVSVVDGRGVPLPQATLFEIVNETVVDTQTTSVGGEADVRIPMEPSSVVLFAVPSSGSFGFRRLTAMDRETGSTRMVIADPGATVAIKCETTDHVPVRDVNFLVRFDGEAIPFDLLMRLAQQRSYEFRSGSDGMCLVSNLPPGMYEFWPYARMADIDAVSSGVDSGSSLRVTAVRGENSATMTFSRRKRFANP